MSILSNILDSSKKDKCQRIQQWYGYYYINPFRESDSKPFTKITKPNLEILPYIPKDHSENIFAIIRGLYIHNEAYVINSESFSKIMNYKKDKITEEDLDKVFLAEIVYLDGDISVDTNFSTTGIVKKIPYCNCIIKVSLILPGFQLGFDKVKNLDKRFKDFIYNEANKKEVSNLLRKMEAMKFSVVSGLTKEYHRRIPEEDFDLCLQKKILI